MADPVELQIVEAVRARLASITVAGGFFTDAGERVRLGRVIDPENDDALPALVVWLDEPATVGTHSPGILRRELTVTVEGVIAPTDDDPLADTIRLGRDIKRAVYRLHDLTLVEPGSSDLSIVSDEHFPAEPGLSTATVQITFKIPYFEQFT